MLVLGSQYGREVCKSPLHSAKSMMRYERQGGGRKTKIEEEKDEEGDGEQKKRRGPGQRRRERS